ncbi:hypothetical protein J2857_001943 [Neorhizobium galegae]|uniref:hypothetical protein n=1 Tax=Neorhizobium galegae TaxID=399 RepID=UPI001AE284BD|nr:hypothetical protein [Neorhizobium galegae]MBP2559192.1 hypothetical protein [Neorhizobium galegae]
MDTISIEAVGQILDLHKSRIEQWISRGQFKPRASGQGKKRDWDLGEVIRLAVFAKLAEDVSLQPAQASPSSAEEARRLAAEEAGRMTQYGVHSFIDDGAFFVCYKTDPDFGWWHEIVRKRDLATFLTSGCEMPKLLMEGRSQEAIRHNSEPSKGPAAVAVVIDLDRIELQVREGWPTAQK